MKKIASLLHQDAMLLEQWVGSSARDEPDAHTQAALADARMLVNWMAHRSSRNPQCYALRENQPQGCLYCLRKDLDVIYVRILLV